MLIFRPVGIKCDDITQPSLATRPNTSTKAGFFDCIIDWIAGGDSCSLTVGDFIRNQSVANVMSGGRTSLRLSLATTNQHVDSMMGCYQPYNFIVFNSDIYKTKRRNIEVNNSGSSDDSKWMLSTSYAGKISPPICAKIRAQRVARRPGGEWPRQTTLPAAVSFRQ